MFLAGGFQSVCWKYFCAWFLLFAIKYGGYFSSVNEYRKYLFILQLEPLSLDFLSTLSYLSVLLVQIYFYCYYGTSLFEEVL
jgi:hypothetical protein